jgi:hypothetical protein
MVGTLRYMPPEQLRGEAGDRRSDVYSLGAVLYEMLTGRVPFASESEYEVIRAQVEDLPRPPSALVPGLPAWLDQAVLRALAKAPADRFQSAEPFRAFLASAGRELPPAAVPAPGEPVNSPRRIGSATPAEISSLPTEIKSPPTTPPGRPAGAPAASSHRPAATVPRRHGAWLALAAALILAVALIAWGLHVRGARSVRPDHSAASGSSTVGISRPAGVVPASSSPAASSDAPAFSPARAVETAARKVAAATPRIAAARRPRRAAAVAAPPVPAPSAVPAAALVAAPPAAGAPASVSASTSVSVPSSTATPGAPAGGAELMERLGELRATSRDLDAAASHLAAAYRKYLEAGEGAARKRTPAEERLQIAIEDIAVSAARFRNAIRPGAPPPAQPAGPGGDRRVQILAHARRMAAGGQQMERLLQRVQPGAEVESAWQDVRRLSRQAIEILVR